MTNKTAKIVSISIVVRAFVSWIFIGSICPIFFDVLSHASFLESSILLVVLSLNLVLFALSCFLGKSIQKMIWGWYESTDSYKNDSVNWRCSDVVVNDVLKKVENTTSLITIEEWMNDKFVMKNFEEKNNILLPLSKFFFSVLGFSLGYFFDIPFGLSG